MRVRQACLRCAVAFSARVDDPVKSINHGRPRETRYTKGPTDALVRLTSLRRKDLGADVSCNPERHAEDRKRCTDVLGRPLVCVPTDQAAGEAALYSGVCSCSIWREQKRAPCRCYEVVGAVGISPGRVLEQAQYDR